MKMVKLKGIGASSGVGIGKAFCLGKEEFIISKRKISHEDVAREIYRLEEALIETRKELSKLQSKIHQELGFDHARIFEAHLLVIEDRVLIEDAITAIKNSKVNVEYAFSQSVNKYIDALLKVGDDYLRERVIDIEDISRRVLRKLLKQEATNIQDITEKVVIVSHDLSPSQTASLPKDNVLGFITDIGGRTSHSAIIARSLQIPAVVGLETATDNIATGDLVIVDGHEGIIIIKPTDKVLKEYKVKLSRIVEDRKGTPLPKRVTKAVTIDKKEFIVSANIELPEELPLVQEYGAEGIGLYRTEYMFLGRKDLPSEEEQYQAYANAARKLKPHPVIIRTMDIGGDKFLSQPQMPKEMSPFLGWRAIRFCLGKPELFKTQLRAILRASVVGNVKIMFPMISGIEELRRAKEMLAQASMELTKKGQRFDKDLSVGIMIEVPSAALTADILAKESDFFSIGTNDLIQYSLAVDRGNEKVAYLYEPGHPAVLRLIKSVIETAHANNIWVGMCGEMSADPIFAFFLLGLELDEFSMSPPQVLKIKELIRHVNFQEVKKISLHALTLSTANDVGKYLQSELKRVLGKHFEKVVMI